MERIVRQTTESSSNRWTQFLNLGLFVVLLALQCFYYQQWQGRIEDTIVDIFLVKVIVQILLMCVMFGLVIDFGQSVVVKSHELANGDLIIVGSSKSGKITFEFVIHSNAAKYPRLSPSSGSMADVVRSESFHSIADGADLLDYDQI